MLNDTDRATQMGPASKEKLRSFIARIERLEGEKSELAADIAAVKAEAKSMGFQVPIITKVIALRKLEDAARSEQEALTEMYLDVVEG